MKVVRIKYQPDKNKKKSYSFRAPKTDGTLSSENKFEGLQWNLKMPGTVYR